MLGRSIIVSIVTAVSATLGLTHPIRAEPFTRFVSPLDTDPLIRDVDLPNADGYPRDHYIATDPGAPELARMFLWLPGTGAAPAQYRAITNLAARLGFDALGLVYDSWPSVNGMTTRDPDPNLPEFIRRERLFGEDGTTLIEVDPANSIDNRLIRLIQHLAATEPDQEWQRYLTEDGAVDWTRIVVGGHSQGAGHAAYLSKQFRLAGAMLIAGPGDFVQNAGPAPWLYADARTSPDRLYALTHLGDGGTPGFFATQRILGLDAFAPIQLVDGLAVFQLSSHMLTSAIDPGHENYHNAVAVDADLPIGDNGGPVYLAAWTFMLDRLATPPGPCPGDADKDGEIDFNDITAVLANWSAVYPPGATDPGDANLDGIVDFNDITAVLANWLTPCP